MEATQSTSDLRIRKFAPVDREYPIIEVLVGEEVLFDVSRDDEGTYEIAFHVAVSNRVMQINALLATIEECKSRLKAEEAG